MNDGLNLLALDFETYYNKDYTLRKLTEEEYIRSPEFEAMVLSLCWVNKPKEHVTLGGSDIIKDWIEAQDWSRIMVICHHAAFDVGILSLRYNVKPKFILCTMSMAKALYGPLNSASLEALAARAGLPAKTVPYNKFMGHRWADLPCELQEALMDGCKHDVELTVLIAKMLWSAFPRDELEIIDLTVRMFTEPVIRGNIGLFREIAELERNTKNDLLADLNVVEAQLQSTATLAKLLEECGEDVPMKPGKLRPIPCLAITDEYLQSLSGRDDRAGDLARARIIVRSTIRETRAHRLAGASARGPLPVYLRYFAAVTGRWGGGGALNFQNLPRSGGMRKGLVAPEGCVFLIVDFSQIEYRILCALSGQEDKLTALEDKNRNLYCEFGETLFRRPITREDKQEYRFSKTIVLGSGYGTGKKKALATARNMKMDFNEDVTDKAIDLYRQEHKRVVALWARLQVVLWQMSAGCVDASLVKDIPVTFNGARIVLPNKLFCEFDLCEDEFGLHRRTAKGIKEPKNIFEKGYTPYRGYGLTEWLCQALARIKLSDLVAKIFRELKIRPALLVHDEYVCIVPEEAAESYLQWIVAWAGEDAAWWKSGPKFAAEGRIAHTYGD